MSQNPQGGIGMKPYENDAQAEEALAPVFKLEDLVETVVTRFRDDPNLCAQAHAPQLVAACVEATNLITSQRRLVHALSESKIIRPKLV